MDGLERLHAESFVLDLRQRCVVVDGVKYSLQEQPFRVLRELMLRAPASSTRDDLRRVIWDEGVVVDFDRGITVNVDKLRRIFLRAGIANAPIETLRGCGYRFAETVRIESGSASDPRLAELCEAADRMSWERRPRDLRRALASYQRVSALAPSLAAAWAGAAECLALLADFEWAPAEEGFARAEACADRALRLDPDHARALSVRAFILHRRDWRLDEAEALYRRASGMPTPDCPGRQWLCELLSQRGRHREALELFADLRHRMPLGSAASIEPWLLLHAGRRDEARARGRELRALGERSVLVDYLGARVSDDPRRGLALAIRAHRRSRGAGFAAAELVRQLRDNGERAVALQVARSIDKPYPRAKAFAALDLERESGLALQAARAVRSPWLLDLRVDPDWTRMQDVPGFRSLQGQLPA